MPLIPYNNPISLPDGTEGITQSLNNSSNKLATTEFVRNEVLDVATYTLEPTGFVNQTDSIISFDNNTRTFSISPVSGSFTYFHAGEKFIVTTTKTLVIPDIEGAYYIYIHNNELNYYQTFDTSLIFQNAFISQIYWDSENQKILFVTDERHGIVMSSATRYYLHNTIGADYRSGFSLTNFSIDGDGSLNSHSQFTVTSGKFADEDIEFEYTSTSQFPIFYKTSTNKWKRKDADSYPIIYNGTVGYTGTRIPYNKYQSGNWSLQEAQEGYYVLLHVFAFNDKSQKIIGILGTNEYSTAASAKNGADAEIKEIAGLPLQEFVPLGTVVFQTSSTYTNATKAILTSIYGTSANYLDYRQISTYDLSGAIGIVNSHSLLLNLDADDHTQYLTNTRGDSRYYTKSEINSSLSNKQDLDATLTALAGLSNTAGIVIQTGIDTFTKRSVQGTSNKISATNGDGVSGNIILDIDSNYAGQSSITTLGTISTGIWNGTTIAIANGGTGAITATSALNNLLPNQASKTGKSLISNGTNAYWSQLFIENPSSPTEPTSAGTNAFAIGNGSVASGEESIVLGGANNTSSARYSSSIGNQAKSDIQSGFAQASGFFANQGDAQTRVFVLRTQTTNAASTEMFIDGTGGSIRLVLPNDTTWLFRASIVARRTDANNESASYLLDGAIDRNATAGSTALVGAAVKTVLSEDNAPWDVAVTADTTNGSLRFAVTGQTGKTVRWVARIEITEVTG